jgi:NAD(P)-dependent dehydrogenase (short-subunit alcohol dehydrogenase family)
MAVVLVTGANGALGKSVVDALARRGDLVAAIVRSPAHDKPRQGVLELAIDGARGDAWAQAIARVDGDLGAIDGAVLTAGAWAGGKPVAESSDAELRAMLDANVMTAHAALRALLPGMLSRGKGSVVVVGSRAAARPWTSTNAAAYAASKAAVVALAEAAAAECVACGVRVNAVLPSTIDTPANRAAMPGADASTWVSLESLAGVIAFLLSDAARDVSGASIPVYGRA